MALVQGNDTLLDVSELDLEIVARLASNCVYSLVNHSKKAVQVFGSTNGLAHLARILVEIKTSGEYKEMLEDLSKLEVVILETNPSNIKVAIHCWMEKYLQEGYRLYKDTSPIRLTLETRVENIRGKLRYCLYAVGKRSYRKLLGVFDKKRDLLEFSNANYKGDRISTLVVHESVELFTR